MSHHTQRLEKDKLTQNIEELGKTIEEYNNLVEDGEDKYIFAYTKKDEKLNKKLEKEFEKLKAPLHYLNLDILKMDKIEKSPCLILNTKRHMMEFPDDETIETFYQTIVLRMKGYEKIIKHIELNK